MGIIDWVKTPEGAFILGMPVGYFLIDWGKKKLGVYLKETGENIGRNIATAIRTQTNGEHEISYKNLEEKVDVLISRFSEMEKKFYESR